MSVLISTRELLGRPVENFESLIVDGSAAKPAIAVSFWLLVEIFGSF